MDNLRSTPMLIPNKSHDRYVLKNDRHLATRRDEDIYTQQRSSSSKVELKWRTDKTKFSFMMHNSKMRPMTPVNGFVVSPNGPPPPTSIPYQFQSNMIPGQNGPNEHSSIPPWNATQVGPQNFISTTPHLWNAQPGMMAQSNQNYIIPPLTSSASWLQAFEKGKPKALGILLIIAAICQIVLGIILPFYSYAIITFYSGIEYWAPIFYISAGSLAISAQKRQSIPEVKASFGLSIVSSIFSTFAVIINAVDLALEYCDLYWCYNYYYPTWTEEYIILSLLLLLNLLVFCVTVSIAVFGGRALDQVPANVPPAFVIQNMAPGSPSA